MNLNDLLDAYRAYNTADQSAATAAVFAREQALLKSRDWRATALAAGQLAPDFALPDSPGGSVRLSDLLVDGPVVLKFYRGRWCPYCTLELRAYQRILPDIKALGARLLAISPQTEAEIAMNRERDALQFQMVTDPDNAIARQFGIVYDVEPDLRAMLEASGLDFTRVNDTVGWTLPLPAVYLIGRDRRIAWSYLDADYRRRAEPAEILCRLKALTAG